MNKSSLYKKRQLQPGESELVDCGSFVLGIQREKEGWFVKVFEDTGTSKEIDTSEISSGEYYQSGKSNTFLLAPALQAKPVVFKGNQIIIAPNQRMNIFVKIPLIFQLYFTKIQEENLLKEIPYKRLSDTWFGEPDNGVAAFSLGNEYCLSFDDFEGSEYEAICPLNIFNNWNQSLELQRMVIKTEHLSLIRNENKIVTSLVKLEYKGQTPTSAVNFGMSKQFHGDSPEILAKPRNEDRKSLLRTNFHFIRNIYNRFE